MQAKKMRSSRREVDRFANPSRYDIIFAVAIIHAGRPKAESSFFVPTPTAPGIMAENPQSERRE